MFISIQNNAFGTIKYSSVIFKIFSKLELEGSFLNLI
jgi:hypothetical protein